MGARNGRSGWTARLQRRRLGLRRRRVSRAPTGNRSRRMTNAGFENVSVEEVREYWNRRPCNIRHSPKPVGSKEYFDEVEARKYFVEPHIPGFAQFARWSGKRVLEIGCGIGTDTINFARQ